MQLVTEDLSKAGDDMFGAELNNRLSDAIEQERISVASNIYLITKEEIGRDA